MVRTCAGPYNIEEKLLARRKHAEKGQNHFPSMFENEFVGNGFPPETICAPVFERTACTTHEFRKRVKPFLQHVGETCLSREAILDNV